MGFRIGYCRVCLELSNIWLRGFAKKRLDVFSMLATAGCVAGKRGGRCKATIHHPQSASISG